MIESKLNLPTLRYSPWDIEGYGHPAVPNAGPAHSQLIAGDAEAWNLAFLSHPYEVRSEHRDPQFTVLVWQTVQTVLSTGELDRAKRVPAENLVRGLLREPADRFLQLLLAARAYHQGSVVPLLPMLPLYRAYGDVWVMTMQDRASGCLRAPVASEWMPGDDVPHVNDAAAALSRIFKK